MERGREESSLTDGEVVARVLDGGRIVARDGKPVLAIGSPGGRTIINTVLQVILNVIDHGMNIGQAVEAGRIHHQWLPDRTAFERFAISPDTQKLYEMMGHEVYFRNGRAKVRLGLARGKKAHDKREALKERDVAREMDRAMRSFKR